MLVPESLAYASIAGVSPVVGLYAAMPALALYSLFGSSRHVIVAPMSATAALSVGIVGDLTDDPTTFLAFTTALSLAVGIAALLAGTFRLGFLAAVISEPVLKGFIVGLALTIMIGQVPALIGVEKGSGNFFEKFFSLLGSLGDLSWITTAVGLACLALLFVLKRFVPLVPGSLAVALLGILAVALFDLDDHGVEIVGTIESGLPSFGLPEIEGSDFFSLLAAGVGVMLVGFAEGLGAAKTYAAKLGYDVDANQELLGLGVSNLGAGMFGGMVVNGSLSKTAVNGSSGAKSQMSALTAAALTLVTLLFLTGLFEQLPEATLAAIVIAAVAELVDVAGIRRLWRAGASRLAALSVYSRRADFIAAVATLMGVLLFDTLPGLVIGIGVSLLLLIARTSRPNVATLVPVAAGPLGRAWMDVRRHPDDAPVPGVRVVRIEGPLMFANSDFVRDRVREVAAESTPDHPITLVVLDADTVPSIDITASAMLRQLSTDLGRDGVTFVVAGEIGQVRDVLSRTEESAAEAELPLARSSVDDAVEEFKA